MSIDKVFMNNEALDNREERDSNRAFADFQAGEIPLSKAIAYKGDPEDAMKAIMFGRFLRRDEVKRGGDKVKAITAMDIHLLEYSDEGKDEDGDLELKGRFQLRLFNEDRELVAKWQRVVTIGVRVGEGGDANE